MFKLEDVLVKVVLETFVGEVDAELLKAVVFVIFKTKNVEHSDGQDLGEATRPTKYFILEMMQRLKKLSLLTFVSAIQQNTKTVSVLCHRTLVVSTRSLMLSRAWLILKTIQSNRALYSDFAMESRTVLA